MCYVSLIRGIEKRLTDVDNVNGVSGERSAAW